MKIVVVGAGKVGYSISKRLSEDDHDVIIIEKSPERREIIYSSLDVMVIVGNGSNPNLLNEIGMEDTDILIAVTNSDEVNLIACHMAKKMGAHQTIARVRTNEYINNSNFNIAEDFNLDLIINPEMVAATEILQILKTSDALDVEDFANGKIRLIEIKVRNNMNFAGKRISDLNLPPKILAVGILRKGEVIIPHGNDEIETLDNMFFLGERNEIEQFENDLSETKVKIESVLLVGGGLIGRNLAILLENNGYKVKVIEKNMSRCEQLADLVNNTMIICGDGTDIELLRQEEIGDNDVIICLTDDDKLNLLVALLAQHLGTIKTFVRVGHPEYITLMEQVGIDIVFSPRLLTSGEILRQIYKGNLLSMSMFEGAKAEALELEVKNNNPLIGVPLFKINLPGPALIGAIVRGEETIVPNGFSVCEIGDRIIIFTLPEYSKRVLKYMEGEK